VSTYPNIGLDSFQARLGKGTRGWSRICQWGDDCSFP